MPVFGVATASSASKSCGAPGYSYAGLQASKGAFGVSATLTAVTQPIVLQGHVAAWVGVGADSEGPGLSNEWLQIGLSALPGGLAELYYEVARSSGIHYVELPGSISRARRYAVAVLEMHGRPNVWRVWVNGHPASRPIWLADSNGSLTPMAMAENLAGGVPSCNRFEYRFDQVALARAPGGSWAPWSRARADVLQDPGWRLVPLATNGFLAAASAGTADRQAAPAPLPSQ
jgi:hypothetical protein